MAYLLDPQIVARAVGVLAVVESPPKTVVFVDLRDPVIRCAFHCGGPHRLHRTSRRFRPDLRTMGAQRKWSGSTSAVRQEK
jgi:hypothetical protein